MSEEVKIKISQPMFEVGELERFDNNIHNIVEEYSKLMFKEKDQILTQRIIMKQEEEIERLNKELEEYKKNFKETNDYCFELKRELQQKENIIKEVREYIEKHLESEYFDYDILEANTIYNRDLYKVLKILDKVGSDKE